VLDVGCGNGRYETELRSRNHCGRLIALDISFGMLRDVQNTARVQADAQALPFPDSTFDVVLAPHMLYHAPDLDAAAAELRRVLAPGGVALVVTNDQSHMDRMIEQVSRLIESDTVMRFIDRFNLDNGGALLARHFEDVTLDRWIGELAVPDPEPVVRYANSLRPLYETQLPAGQTWDEMMRSFRALVEQDISATGAWRCTTHSGVFVCR